MSQTPQSSQRKLGKFRKQSKQSSKLRMTWNHPALQFPGRVSGSDGGLGMGDWGFDHGLGPIRMTQPMEGE